MKSKTSDIVGIIIIGLLFLASVVVLPLIKDWLYTVTSNKHLLQVSDYGFNLVKLTIEHVEMSVLASIATIIVGFAIGVFASVGIGKQFKHLIERVTALANALPALGVLAILIPILGYGMKSAAVALLFCGVMPIIFNTITGLGSVPQYMIELGEGLGMSKVRVFFNIKLPLACPVIMAGVRSSAIIIIGCATLAAMAGAGGLGTLIYAAGVRGFDPIMLLQGALPVCLFALFVDRIFAYCENRLKEKFAIASAA